jgi:CRP-like cAMP-binding protein
MKSIGDLLAEHPFFSGLAPAHIALLAGCGRNVHFKQHETVFREGEVANYFYVLRRGKIALEINGAERGVITVHTVEDGEILGWSWLIPPHQWRFTGHALQATSAVALDGSCLRGKCQDDHQLGYELLKRFSTVLAQRLESTRLQLVDIYGVPQGSL